MRKFKDYSGERFGLLVAEKLATPPRNNGKTFWIMRCDCGTTKTVAINSCVQGETKSCGCLQQEHYKKNTTLGKKQRVINHSRLQSINNALDDGYTKTYIAKKLGISRTTLNSYLSGKTKPRQANQKEPKKLGNLKVSKNTEVKCYECGSFAIFYGTRNGKNRYYCTKCKKYVNPDNK